MPVLRGLTAMQFPVNCTCTQYGQVRMASSLVRMPPPIFPPRGPQQLPGLTLIATACLPLCSCSPDSR
jgi:hypothetical protein